MNVYTTKAPVTITCPKRLAPWLEQETRQLGFDIDEVFITGLRLKATLNECIRLNLQLRCASQVLYSLGHFAADEPDDLYKFLSRFPWEELLPQTGRFSVTSNVNHPTVNNNLFANLRVKDAIVDRMREKHGSRPQSGSTPDGAVFHLFWKNSEAAIFLDTSGSSLGRHGYRKIPGQAPMLESLAAATIYATNWDGHSPFVNPMCGSGTVAIEAALIATNRRPGLFRNNYGFMHLIGYDENVYLQEKQLLLDQIMDRPGLVIIASDYSSTAIANAKKNAGAAEVDHLIHFSVCDFADTPLPPHPPGILFFNPEYGQRLGELSRLEETYSRMGDFMKKKGEGYRGYVFTGNLDLAKKIGLKAKRRIEFYTSTIDCRLLEYELYQGSRAATPTAK